MACKLPKRGAIRTQNAMLMEARGRAVVMNATASRDRAADPPVPPKVPPASKQNHAAEARANPCDRAGAALLLVLPCQQREPTAAPGKATEHCRPAALTCTAAERALEGLPKDAKSLQVHSARMRRAAIDCSIQILFLLLFSYITPTFPCQHPHTALIKHPIIHLHTTFHK